MTDRTPAKTVLRTMKLTRIAAGHYYTVCGYDQVDIREYAKGDWELKINDEHRGYFGRLSDAKAAVIRDT